MNIFRALTPAALALLSSTAFAVDNAQVDGERLIKSMEAMPAYEVRVLPLSAEQAARLKRERDKHRESLEELKNEHDQAVQRILFADQ